MIQPCNTARRSELTRPTFPNPKSEPTFSGWGPRLRF